MKDVYVMIDRFAEDYFPYEYGDALEYGKDPVEVLRNTPKEVIIEWLQDIVDEDEDNRDEAQRLIDMLKAA